ncbi:MAG: PDZ domain-containing protein [Gemmatimonadota bacterium]
MRFTNLLALAAVAGATASTATAQSSRASTIVTSPSFYRFDAGDDHRAALGVSTSTSGTLRDTLGILVTAITKGSPAEKAGLEEGNRIAAINGVNLRANAADIEDNEMSSALTRRLTRELAKVKAGDDVDLRVYRDGKMQNIKVKTADAAVLFGSADRDRVWSTASSAREDAENRPVLGVQLGSTGSRRDTLGVLVMSVTDSSPASRAGIEEGNRIAAINGVNLRVSRDDAGDRFLSSSKVTRLQREIGALKPGDNVTLSVYSNGRTRDVTMKVARAGDLPKSSGFGYTIVGDGFAPMPALPMMAPMPSMPSMPRMAPTPRAPSVRYDYEFSPEVRERLEEARVRLDEARVRINAIRPTIDARLERTQPRVRVESVRPQIERTLERAMPRIRVEARPTVAPRIRIVNTTV